MSSLDFWQTVGADVLSGVCVAVLTAGVALLIVDRYAERRRQKQAASERSLAAIEELYTVYGEYFLAWKGWEQHRKKTPDFVLLPCDDRRRIELIDKAAQAEGRYESFLVRIAAEYDLGPRQEATLWCLREALQELRTQILQNEPLEWWRNDIHPAGKVGYEKYQQFKSLVARAGGILIGKPSEKAVPEKNRVAALKSITGDGGTYVRQFRLATAKPAWWTVGESMGEAPQQLADH